MTDIPHVTEGIDLFDDQSAALEFVAPEPHSSPQKFAEEVRLLLAEKGIPEEEILYRFGIGVESLSAMQCLEAKQYIERLQIASVKEKEDELGYHDLVIVIDSDSRYHRYSGLVCSTGNTINVYRLSRGLSDAHGLAWDKGVSFTPEQLKLKKRAPKTKAK